MFAEISADTAHNGVPASLRPTALPPAPLPLQVHALGLLRFILTHLSHNGLVVSLQQAIDVEARCLDALDWRLGPFFLEDDLTGRAHEQHEFAAWCGCDEQEVLRGAGNYCTVFPVRPEWC